MRLKLLPIYLFFPFFWANAQDSVIDSWGGEFPVSPLEEYGKAYRPGLPVPADYTGSFYFEEDFIPGVIVVEGKEEQMNVFLRYNALKDQVEYKMSREENEVRLLPAISNISYRTSAYDYIWKTLKVEDGKEINGYVISYFNGAEAKFLAKPIAYLQPEVLPRTGYDRYKPANMSVKLIYLLSIGGEPFKEVKLEEKQIKKQLPDSSSLKDYFSNHKLETVDDVVKLLKIFEEHQSSL